MAETIARFAPAAAALLGFIKAAPVGVPWRLPITDHLQVLEANRVPAELALKVAAAGTLFAALDIADVGELEKKPLEDVATAYFAIGDLLGLARLRLQVTALPSDGYWQAMAKGALGDDLAGLQRELTADALHAGGLAAWEAAQRPAIERARRMLTELADSKSADLAMLSVALRELRNLA
jgi:glutamate dehydrogenase